MPRSFQRDRLLLVFAVAQQRARFNLFECITAIERAGCETALSFSITQFGKAQRGAAAYRVKVSTLPDNFPSLPIEERAVILAGLRKMMSQDRSGG